MFLSRARGRGLGGTRGLLSSVIQTWTWRGSTRITARRQNPRSTLTQCASVGAALGDAICSPHAQGAGTDCTRSRHVAKLNHCGPHLPSPFRQNISYTPIVWSTCGRRHQDTLTIGRSLIESIACKSNFVSADVVCGTGCTQESRWRSGNGAHGRSARPDPLQAFLRHWAQTSSLRLRVSLLSSSAVSWRACSCFDRRARAAPVPFDHKLSCFQRSSPPVHRSFTFFFGSLSTSFKRSLRWLAFGLVALQWNLQISVKLQASVVFREVVPQLKRCHNSASALGFFFRESLRSA